VIYVLGVRFLNLSALIVAEANMAFAAAGGDPPTWPLQTKRRAAAISDHWRSAVAHVHWNAMARAVTQ
jgi:hypothetical protein